MLDLRMPIGAFFLILGTLVCCLGYWAPVTTQLGERGINLNITWGAVMGIFGVVMTMLAIKTPLEKPDRDRDKE